MQFMMMNMNPMRTVVFRVTGVITGVSSFRCNARKPQPTPTNRLKAGPAKAAVVAMFGSCNVVQRMEKCKHKLRD